MSISELTANRIPRYNRRVVKRRLNGTRNQIVRSVRRARVKAERKAVAWHRRQYYVATGMTDLRLAIGHNEDVFLGGIIASLLLLYAFAVSSTQLLFFSFQAISTFSDATGVSMGMLTLLTLSVLATTSTWFLVLIINFLSMSVLDGANRKQRVSLRNTFRRALGLTTRVSLGWLLLAVFAGTVLTVVGLPSLLYGLSHFQHAAPSPDFIAVSGGVLLAALYALGGFILAPQVALFEPALPLSHTLLRSHKLLGYRGRLYVMTLGVFAAGLLALAYGLSDWLQNFFGYSGNLVFYVFLLAVITFGNLLLTVLYRKSKRLLRTAGAK